MSERQREITLRFLAEPTDINYLGKMHGGAVMRWIDLAGYACAAGWSGHNCVTVYVGGIRFYKPIQIGDLVEVSATLIYTGRTSMHIAIDVRARDPRAGTFTNTTHCIIVFVALDNQGQPIETPTWTPTTKEDIALRDYAIKLMEMRKGIEDEMEHFRGW